MRPSEIFLQELDAALLHKAREIIVAGNLKCSAESKAVELGWVLATLLVDKLLAKPEGSNEN